jgi:hypothetical protein
MMRRQRLAHGLAGEATSFELGVDGRGMMRIEADDAVVRLVRAEDQPPPGRLAHQIVEREPGQARAPSRIHRAQPAPAEYLPAHRNPNRSHHG